MTRASLLLLVALVASGMYLVKTAYEARRLFSQIDRARTEEDKLNTEFKRLDAERQAQATNLRVDKVARERLRMVTATAAVTQRMSDNPASGAAR